MPINKELVALDFQRMILLFMEYCLSKQLRPKTMHAYEKTLRLFAKWLQENEEITKADAVKEMHIRRYILELQSRGKYTACSDEHSKKINFPENRSDYNEKVSNITINNYLRNLRVFFAWMEESECIVKSPMKRIKLLPAERKAKEFLEDDEVKALMRVMDKSLFSEYRDLLIMMVMLDSGTRLGETLSITNEELNRIYKSVGLSELKGEVRTGGSDAAYVTEQGIPCVDSVGVSGGNLHSKDEYAYIRSLEETAKRLAAVVYLWDRA